MRLFIVYILLISFGWLLSSFDFNSNEPNDKSFIIIELFTSQGCSSCPAADKLLSNLMASNDRILALSFHVSYWNYLGWKDPYSKEEFTNRQRKYSRVMGLSRVYTPQMIINGQDEFVGSNKKYAEQSLKEALSKNTLHKIKLSLNIEGKSIKGQYTLAGSTSGYMINLALVERDVSNIVPRGENSGRTLHHDNVVRSFKTIEAHNTGEVSINLPSGIAIEKSIIIAYVQHSETLKITGAAKHNLN